LAARKVYNSGNSTCNVFTKKGENELHFLAIHGKDEKIWSVLKKYVGEIPEHAKKRKDVEGHTPLDYALLHNNSVAIKHLS
jgi:ankyrin repeat protein